MGRSAGDGTRACARPLGQVSGRMYQESHGEVGWRQHARVGASFGDGEWSNVSGVTWGGSPGDSTRACARALGQVSGRMYQESHGEVG